ncbi:HNH endonuclease [Streptomyces olivaceiscleroticus]|uniref:HNH domain-containing protein n=1 Tax=Streptomyces olivaceiscleroticus TaxID=68245 RepID=A0ABP3JGS9_9ACTN
MRYTRELLAEAANRCNDIEEVIAYCGSRSHPELRRRLIKRFEGFGIDISHFSPVPRRTAHPRPPRESLRVAVSASWSVADALRRLGKPVTSCTRTLFRQWVTEAAIDTTHFRGQAHKRGKSDSARLRADEILVRRDAGYRTRTSLLRRALMEIGVAERCSTCGTPPLWYGRPMTLEIDHISGDWSDNRAENLRLLCPNCHAITSTWCRGGNRRRNVSHPKGTQ